MILPEEFITRMKSIPGFDFEAFLSSYETPPVSGIRLNIRKENGEELIKKAFGELEKVDWCKTGFYADKDKIKGTDPYHMAGLFYFQEPSAMCAAELLPINKGDIVLDLCAAPGGKTTHIAQNRDIVLVSNEIIPKRCRVLSENVERMGFENVVVTNESPENLEKKFPEFFDSIIIDAPCSGEGMFKKEPAAIEAWSPEHVKSCADRQKKIIESAMKMLRPGGKIVYSTCTFSPDENELMAEYIVNKYPFMSLEREEHIYPHLAKGEGHYAALFSDSRESVHRIQKESKQADKAMQTLYREFEKKYLNKSLSGEIIAFGENLYLKPECINVDGIKTIRPGLHLGVCRKGRFEPEHALAMSLEKNDFKQYVEFTRDDIETVKYLRGETLSGDITGFGAVVCDGLVLGWCKGSGGILKNRYPKGLRLF